MRIHASPLTYPHPSTRGPPITSPRSLQHEYQLYVEREIEDYKDSVSRSALLSIGDEAVRALQAGDQFGLTELLVWQEVDRIITRRLGLPAFSTWRRRRLKDLEEYRKPEHWGIDPDAALVRALRDSADRHVLVAGAQEAGPAMYLAARGCAVTTVAPEADAVDRVLRAAEAAGFGERVRSLCGGLDAWRPDVELHAVVCSPAALARLTPSERARVIEVLQSATADGGVHLLETIAAGSEGLALDELTSRYRGWSISIERAAGRPETFLARKQAAVA